ncbi:MAG: hypothetical protein SFV54_06840 [Bryobacteraceae bacterium]|nr:hypothetical protein [Bryobacteraceae bacterium]
MASIKESALLGRVPEELSIDDRRAFAGWWIAVPLYSPATLPPRAIAAAAPSSAACIAALRSQGRDPRAFELTIVQPPFR